MRLIREEMTVAALANDIHFSAYLATVECRGMQCILPNSSVGYGPCDYMRFKYGNKTSLIGPVFKAPAGVDKATFASQVGKAACLMLSEDTKDQFSLVDVIEDPQWHWDPDNDVLSVTCTRKKK